MLVNLLRRMVDARTPEPEPEPVPVDIFAQMREQVAAMSVEERAARWPLYEPRVEFPELDHRDDALTYWRYSTYLHDDAAGTITNPTIS